MTVTMAGLIIVALAGLAACASPIPTPHVDGSPTGSSVPTRTAGSAATATPDPGSTPTITNDGTGSATDVALRLTVYEFPSPRTVIEPPEFTLYGDGAVIYAVKQRAPGEFWPSVELRAARMWGEQMSALMAGALDGGGLRDARSEYDIPGGALGLELEWNYFQIRADGIDKQVRVYGLGYESAPDAAERVKFAGLAERLLDFSAEIEAGRATDAGAFEPEAYDAFLTPWRFPDELGVNAEWPWPEIDASDFANQPNGTPMRRLTREQGEAVLDMGVDEYLIAEAPDGKPYKIQIRPLLPDETASSARSTGATTIAW